MEPQEEIPRSHKSTQSRCSGVHTRGVSFPLEGGLWGGRGVGSVRQRMAGLGSNLSSVIYGRCGLRHIFNLSDIWSLPLFKGEKTILHGEDYIIGNLWKPMALEIQ